MMYFMWLIITILAMKICPWKTKNEELKILSLANMTSLNSNIPTVLQDMIYSFGNRFLCLTIDMDLHSMKSWLGTMMKKQNLKRISKCFPFRIYHQTVPSWGVIHCWKCNQKKIINCPLKIAFPGNGMSISCRWPSNRLLYLQSSVHTSYFDN